MPYLLSNFTVGTNLFFSGGGAHGQKQQGERFTKPIIVCEHVIVPYDMINYLRKNKMDDNIKSKLAWYEIKTALKTILFTFNTILNRNAMDLHRLRTKNLEMVRR